MISSTMILNMNKFSRRLLNELQFEIVPQMFINLWSNGHMYLCPKKTSIIARSLLGNFS